MGKSHLKTLTVPKQWPVKRKERTFAIRPKPRIKFQLGMPLGIIIRDILGYANNLREVKYILRKKDVLVNGTKVLEHRFLVGIFDTIAFKELKKQFRMVLNDKGKLQLIPIGEKELSLRPCRIINKTKIKGKSQLNLDDGRNMLVDNDAYHIGDSLLLELPGQLVKEHLKLEKGVLVFMLGGKHLGKIGTVTGITGNNIAYKTPDGMAETLKQYAFVIGKEHPVVTVREDVREK